MFATLTALAEPNRFRIVELLRTGARPVNDIAARLDLLQPHVSRHLRILKEAGVVDVRPVAQQRVYELRGAAFRELAEWAERYRQLWDDRFEAMEELFAELQTKKEKEHGPRRKK